MLRRHTKVTTATQASYLAAAAKFALLFAACLAFQALVAGQPLVIQSVTISGTERPLQLETKAGELFERARVARDVKRLWATGWFDDIRVLTEAIPQGAGLRFVLVERPRYLLRRVRLEPRHFGLSAPALPGSLVDRASVERQSRTFQEGLRDSGYRDAVVNVELIPVGIRQADVLLRVNSGKRYVVDGLEISGISPADTRQVARITRPVRPRTLLPGIPRVWKGWKLRPQLNQEDLDLALQRVRSNYISRGYLDATTNLEPIAFKGALASISIRVRPGAAYRLEALQVSDSLSSARLDMGSNPSPIKELCRCLIENRVQAERRGVVDYRARLLVQPSHKTEAGSGQAVSLFADVQTGPSYRVRRIEFRGNHHLSDVTLRKMLLLSEGDWFDRGRLRRSLTRLNSTGLIHPVSEWDVEVNRDSAQLVVDVVISVGEKDRGRWLIGAPAGVGLARSSWFSVGLRLPSWGPSSLELPTHFIALNLMSPLPLSMLTRANFSISLARPYLPGQGWRSGFYVSPQASWPKMLLSTGLLQVRPRLEQKLQSAAALEVPVHWSTPSSDEPSKLTAGVLICLPPPNTEVRLLHYLHIAAEWLFATGL